MLLCLDSAHQRQGRHFIFHRVNLPKHVSKEEKKRREKVQTVSMSKNDIWKILGSSCVPGWHRAAHTSHIDWLSLSPVTPVFLLFSYPRHPPLHHHHHPRLSSQEGKYKEPLQIPPYRGFICIISALLQVSVAAAATCTMQIELQPGNRCDIVPDESALSSTMISWTWAWGKPRSWWGHDSHRPRPHCYCCLIEKRQNFKY